VWTVVGLLTVARTVFSETHTPPSHIVTPHASISPPSTAVSCPTAQQLPLALTTAYLATPKGSSGLTTTPSAPKAVINAGMLGNVATITLDGMAVSGAHGARR